MSDISIYRTEELTRAIQERVIAAYALAEVTGDDAVAALVEQKATLQLQLEVATLEHLKLSGSSSRIRCDTPLPRQPPQRDVDLNGTVLCRPHTRCLWESRVTALVILANIWSGPL